MDCFVAYAPRNDVFASIFQVKTYNVDVAGGEEVVDGGFRDFVVEIRGLVAAHLIRLEFQELIVYRF